MASLFLNIIYIVGNDSILKDFSPLCVHGYGNYCYNFDRLIKK